ncbi:MAG: DUF3127 domain-containing protein [Bacteroidales bacterium]
MEIQGKVIELLPEATGEGRNGTWRKQEFILETQDQFPKKVCIALWGDRIDQYNLQVGEEVNASVNIESREYNSRWYTDVKAWKIDKVSAANPPLPGQDDDPGPTEMPPQDNDLPF